MPTQTFTETRVNPVTITAGLECVRDRASAWIEAIRVESRGYDDLAKRMLALAGPLHRLQQSRYGAHIAGHRASAVAISLTEMSLRPLRNNEQAVLLPMVGGQAQTRTRMVIQGHLFVTYDGPQSLFYCADLSDIYPFIHSRFGGGYESQTGFVRHYSVTMYLDDFPGLAREYLKYLALQAAKIANDDSRHALAGQICRADDAYINAQERLNIARAPDHNDHDEIARAEHDVVALEAMAFACATKQLPFDLAPLEELARRLGV